MNNLNKPKKNRIATDNNFVCGKKCHRSVQHSVSSRTDLLGAGGVATRFASSDYVKKSI